MYERIKAVEELKQCPTWDTPLGGKQVFKEEEVPMIGLRDA